MDKLTNQWKEARDAIGHPTETADRLIDRAREKKKAILYFHYRNIIVLTITLIMLSSFFYFVAPLKELLSKTGAGLMLGGLLLRIIIEVVSTLKSKSIQLINNVSKTTNDTLIFYNFRKKIHGPVTIIIVALYIIGFYLLSPEFSKYTPLKWMIIMDSSFILGAIVLIWQIRKGIQKEMKNLLGLENLKKQITET